MLILHNNYIIMYNPMTQFSVWSEIGISFAIIELRNTTSQNSNFNWEINARYSYSTVVS